MSVTMGERAVLSRLDQFRLFERGSRPTWIAECRGLWLISRVMAFWQRSVEARGFCQPRRVTWVARFTEDSGRLERSPSGDRLDSGQQN